VADLQLLMVENDAIDAALLGDDLTSQGGVVDGSVPTTRRMGYRHNLYDLRRKGQFCKMLAHRGAHDGITDSLQRTNDTLQ